MPGVCRRVRIEINAMVDKNYEDTKFQGQYHISKFALNFIYLFLIVCGAALSSRPSQGGFICGD
jgi:hypothetical protein